MGFQVHTNIQAIPATPVPQIPTPQSLSNQLVQALPNYAPKLWSTTKPSPTTKPLDLANYTTKSNKQIITFSDTSLNYQKQSTFMWVISTNDTELWTGTGTTPGMQKDAHSGQTEGYGLLAAFTFIEQYVKATT